MGGGSKLEKGERMLNKVECSGKLSSPGYRDSDKHPLTPNSKTINWWKLNNSPIAKWLAAMKSYSVELENSQIIHLESGARSHNPQAEVGEMINFAVEFCFSNKNNYSETTTENKTSTTTRTGKRGAKLLHDHKSFEESRCTIEEEKRRRKSVEEIMSLEKGATCIEIFAEMNAKELDRDTRIRLDYARDKRRNKSSSSSNFHSCGTNLGATRDTRQRKVMRNESDKKKSSGTWKNDNSCLNNHIDLNRSTTMKRTATRCQFILFLVSVFFFFFFLSQQQQQQSVAIASLHNNRFFLNSTSLADEMSLAAMASEFKPTRRPPPQQVNSRQINSRSDSEEDEEDAAGSDARREDESRRKSSSRRSDLDLYLDDMDHNELRAVASGKPLGDLFGAKRVAPESAAAQSDGGSVQLEGQQSEQQIYSECALILQRTYVKNIDHPDHQLIPFGKTEQSCISYKHIDKAIKLAKQRLKLQTKDLSREEPRGFGKPQKALTKAQATDLLRNSLEPPEDLIAQLGELNMATTQIIADQFDLSNDELLNGLPLIDMSKTKFWRMCPKLVRSHELKCDPHARYRTLTGHCNNLKHPTWGAAMTPFARYLPPVHPDGIWVPRKSVVTETTFHLTVGHRETHADIEPAAPAPHFDEPRAAGPGSGADAEEPVEGDEHEARGTAHSWRRTVHKFERRREEHLEAAPSVQFAVRHPALPAAAADMELDRRATSDSVAPIGGRRQRPGVPSSLSVEHALPEEPDIEKTTTAAPGGGHLNVAASSVHPKGNRGRGRSAATELPSARLVTSVVHRDVYLPSHDFTILFMSWGQLLDHDMTRAAQPPPNIKCCGDDNREKHPLCLPIEVPEHDPFYGKFRVSCLEFRRSLAGLRPNCVLGPRVHQNAITAPIDANFVYGSSRAMADALRLFKGGRLRARDWFKHEGLKPLLPAQELEPDADCIARPRDLFCFLAGDVRANEQTHLTVLHTLYMREHNRLASRLQELNPQWSDERLYQETRHIVAAGVQHVLISEYLPLLIGRKMTELYNLTAHSPQAHAHHSRSPEHAYWHGYDPTVTTSVANSFAAAAFRQGHTFVQGTVERYNKFHELVASEQLRRLFKQPFLLYQPGVLDELTGGMVNQPSQNYDPFISEDISGHLFQPPESQFGHDLPAINLQRGREQGLPGYNLFREWCGLPRAESFHQLEPYLTNQTAYQYSRLYKHVDDIDLWSGGVSERRLPGAAIGPTFACIIARQFSNTRRGDRFWYENPGLPSSFTPAQLAEIRKISLAKILCQNSDDLPTIQRWALRMAHPVLNPRLDCSQLPEMDLGPWQEQD